MSAVRDPRRQRLARIHQGKKALGLDEAEYRALLQRASDGVDGLDGVSSSALMSEAQQLAVIRAMTERGFQIEAAQHRARRRWPGEPKDCAARPMLRKLRALLADGKKPWAYAHAMGKRMFGVARVEWLHDGDLHKLVAALQVDARRRGGAR
ncbi:MAG TPA: regulatory protein GemA [Chiayiivirga sp.]|nr:regulatory protein GemA [Chiayiivirga sp.]